MKIVIRTLLDLGLLVCFHPRLPFYRRILNIILNNLDPSFSPSLRFPSTTVVCFIFSSLLTKHLDYKLPSMEVLQKPSQWFHKSSDKIMEVCGQNTNLTSKFFLTYWQPIYHEGRYQGQEGASNLQTKGRNPLIRGIQRDKS